MGVNPALAGAFALDDSNSWLFSLEFSLAAVFSFGSRDLRGRSVVPACGIIRLRRGYGGRDDPGCNGAWSHGGDGRCNGNPAHDLFVRFSADMDLPWARSSLVPLGNRAAP